MKKLNSKELRDEWIKFYEERGHKNIGSVSLIGDGTTGVLFNVAGMQHLVPYLLGKNHPDGKRLCNVQGCIRTVDIDSVGDTSHATFFEMLGSWSLGDYFKEERCKWSFELFTNVLGIPKERLATTCFEGDDAAPRDNEVALIKEKVGFKKENIYFLPKSENWWEIEFGPCGPDSEYFYITDKPACSENCNPSCNCGHFIEIGNDVFMQYEKVDKNKYVPLNKKNVDTGWGLERILAFLNTDDGDIYKTDLYSGVIKILEDKLNIKYNDDPKIDKSIRIILDHTRTSVMLLGDEKHLTPSNIGAGYILRRLIRRSVRHIKKLNLDPSIMIEISKYFIEEVYNESYPNLLLSEEFILDEIKKEEELFIKTLESGEKKLNELILSGNKITGSDVFKLYDTYGFPYELTCEILEEKEIIIDKDEFDKCMENQRTMARNSSKKASSMKLLGDIADFKEKSEFIGYDNLSCESKVIFVGDDNGNRCDIYDSGIVIFDKTVFYATSGGQEGDTGYIIGDNLKVEVLDTIKAPNGQNMNLVRIISGSIKEGMIVKQEVDKEKRYTTTQNHSAAHLLQKSLQEILGDEVYQKGSLVNSDILRFDFNYTGKITDEEVIEVEKRVNEKINEANDSIIEEMDINDAKKLGAMALFSEKYGNIVRVVKLGNSVELCGGCHVKNTKDIRSFAIKYIESKGTNIYRIEAVCDTNLEIELFSVIKPYNDEMILLLKKAKKIVEGAKEEGINLIFDVSISNERPKCYKDILDNKEEVMMVRKKVNDLEYHYNIEKKNKALNDSKKYLEKKQKGKYGDVLILELNDIENNVLKDLSSKLLNELDNGSVFISNKKDDKVNFVLRINDNLKENINAGSLIKDVSTICEGKGGGANTFAMGGATNLDKIDMAIEFIKDNLL